MVARADEAECKAVATAQTELLVKIAELSKLVDVAQAEAGRVVCGRSECHKRMRLCEMTLIPRRQQRMLSGSDPSGGEIQILEKNKEEHVRTLKSRLSKQCELTQKAEMNGKAHADAVGTPKASWATAQSEYNPWKFSLCVQETLTQCVKKSIKHIGIGRASKN